MSMLMSGGIEIYFDNQRQPDDDNPKGYFECEKVKKIYKNSEWLYHVQGKGIKIISHLLYYLPSYLHYKVIFVHRNMKEIIKSQNNMYKRITGPVDSKKNEILASKFSEHLKKIDIWMQAQKNIQALHLLHSDIIHNPTNESQKIQFFLNRDIDIYKMALQVDNKLYRNRIKH